MSFVIILLWYRQRNIAPVWTSLSVCLGVYMSVLMYMWCTLNRYMMHKICTALQSLSYSCCKFQFNTIIFCIVASKCDQSSVLCNSKITTNFAFRIQCLYLCSLYLSLSLPLSVICNRIHTLLTIEYQKWRREKLLDKHSIFVSVIQFRGISR